VTYILLCEKMFLCFILTSALIESRVVMNY